MQKSSPPIESIEVINYASVGFYECTRARQRRDAVQGVLLRTAVKVLRNRLVGGHLLVTIVDKYLKWQFVVVFDIVELVFGHVLIVMVSTVLFHLIELRTIILMHYAVNFYF